MSRYAQAVEDVRVLASRMAGLLADVTLAFDPNQPRDPKGSPTGGQWTSEGGAAVADNSSDTKQAATATTPEQIAAMARQAEKDLATAMQVDQDKVVVVNDPRSVAAAQRVTSVFAELQAAGYPMPDRVLIGVSSANEPWGLARYPDDRVDLELYVPVSLPVDITLDEAAKVAFDGFTTTTSARDLVVHEMAHVYMGSRIGPAGWADEFRDSGVKWDSISVWIDEALGKRAPGVARHRDHFRLMQETAMTVSRYAWRNPSEFAAETFVRLHRGESLPLKVHGLYRRVGGKYPIGYRPPFTDAAIIAASERFAEE